MPDISYPLVTSFAVLGVAAFVGVLFSLRRNPDALVEESSDRAVALLQEQFDELESEHQLGKLNDAEFSALQSELAERLKEEIDANSKLRHKAGQQRLPVLAILLAALLTPAISVAIYTSLGSPQTSVAVAAIGPNDGKPEFVAMIASLEGRLASDPDDADGWRMLGRSYRVIGNLDKSVAAYQQSMERGNADNVEVILDTVEAITLQAEASKSSTYPLMSKLLAYRAAELAPENPKALWYAHIAAANTGDIQLAVKHLESLRDLNPPPEVLMMVNKQLKDLEAAGAALNQPVTKAAVANKSLTITVDIADSLKARIEAGAKLYVFAKATDGSRVPVAVWRGLATSLPAVVTLDDSLSLMPASGKFSDYDQWIVTARVSQQGGAIANAGDLFSEKTMTLADNGMTITISEVVN
ncbi:MAG: cytochrome c-type biogenesis protein CcmH [Gammaproteobacteria bacterium]|jgi:cytochrome c-type biogenesis protein CcmH